MTTPRRPSPIVRIQDLERRVNTALSKLENVTPGLAPMVNQSQAEVSYLQADVDQLKSRCTTIESALAETQTAIADLTARIVKLEKNKK